jgi:hypothetical protein
MRKTSAPRDTFKPPPAGSLLTCRRLGLLGVILASLAGAASGAAGAEEPTPVPRFADQAASYFDLWDDDGDGDLSFQETSRRVPDTTIQGAAAAALASIHLAQRLEKWKQADFSKGVLMARPDPGAGRVPPFEAYYVECYAHIRATDRVLFTATGASLRGLHQGPLGDCYFVATLGALVARDATELARIVRVMPEGGFEVRFPNGESSRVAAVSDAEIALGSFAAGQGLWLNVLEKAYGALVARALQRRRVFENAIDAVGGGGLATSAMALFTGCDAGVLQFRPDDAPMIDNPVRVEGYLPLARDRLIDNLRRQRLTCCGTTRAQTPPGIAQIHLYAVLGFDTKNDLVHLWNPWGNQFTPQGPPGIENGFPVRDGHFFVPLADFIRIFASMTYQTDRPESLD